jgi:hypothetical protein
MRHRDRGPPDRRPARRHRAHGRRFHPINVILRPARRKGASNACDADPVLRLDCA